MIVDSQNRETGAQLRSITPCAASWIRASYVFVEVSDIQTKKKRFLVQERTDTKDYAPGCYMLSSGGVFGPGEGKQENALRELKEETGITVNTHLCGLGYPYT